MVGINNVNVWGSNALKWADIVSNGGYNSSNTFTITINDDINSNYEINCTSNDICFINCQSSYACSNLGLVCEGTCYISCDNETGMLPLS